MNERLALNAGVLVALLFAATATPALAQPILTNNPPATVLTFSLPPGDLAPVPDYYGDRFGVGTSNVVVEFGPPGSLVRKARGPYGTLLNVACQEDGDFGVLEIRLTADAGYQVVLLNFDLAALADDVVLPRVEVLGDYGLPLHAREEVWVPGFGGTNERFDFAAAPLQAGTVLIRVDLSGLANTDSHLLGIDNIAFRQAIATGCPPPPPLSITRAGSSVVLSWPGSGYRLEMITSLPGTTGTRTWGSVPGASPVTVPIQGGAGFFRLVCP